MLHPHFQLPTADTEGFLKVIDLPDSDDTPVDNELQDLIPGLLKLLLSMIWADRQDWFWGTDMALYFDPDDEPIVPDGFLAIGVPRIKDENLRRSYLLWEEKVVPVLTLEVVSRKRRGEYGQKKLDYAALGVRYYAIYNTLRKVKTTLEIYRLEENGEYALVSDNPVWLPELGLGLGLERGVYQGIERDWLYWYDQSGKRYPTPEERTLSAEAWAQQEAQSRLLAEERASKVQAELEALRQRLQDLGIAPDI
ncbi:MAG: Uma2 family endonuclease [Anaerolineae bacterium]|nr:Uma2 family endonuclease [Gloeobacterales cyanobacterium ES-bin-313]